MKNESRVKATNFMLNGKATIILLTFVNLINTVDKSKNVRSGLRNLKSKVLDIGEIETTPCDLSKLIDSLKSQCYSDC